MKTIMTYKVTFACILLLITCSLSAQKKNDSNAGNLAVDDAAKRLDSYLELQKLGFSEKEIFADLGNANFLSENYETAIFWYNKLKETNSDKTLTASYEERYQFALKNLDGVSPTHHLGRSDWVASVKSDYQNKTTDHTLGQVSSEKFRTFSINDESEEMLNHQLLTEYHTIPTNDVKLGIENSYRTPIALSSDGKTAYFSKRVHQKPLKGIFSKEEAVHKIYKADKINGQWKNIDQIEVCPKYASAMHPALSPDGKRLFFASNMPGSFGKFDIYVVELKPDGLPGVAKNLGLKVNTTKNDLYPTILEGGALFFASEGREGYGGLDVYMTEVGRKKVALAVNLGKQINSKEDDFAISLIKDKAMGYVMTNRGQDKDTVKKIAFVYSNPKRMEADEKKEYNLMAAFNNEVKVDYTSSVFEDE